MTQRTKLSFDDQRALAHVLGTPAESKRISAELDEACGVQLHLRGSELTLEGEDAEARQLVARLFTDMVRMAASGRAIARADVMRAFRVLQSDPNIELATVFEDVIIAKTQAGRGIAPRSLSQKRYVELMRRKPLVFGVGPAGTGKTFLAVAMAVRSLLDKQVRRIILTRPAIEAGESLGFLPGSFEEKVSPYMRPLYDGLEEMLDYNKVQRLTEQGVIEIAPLAYMRGRTLNDAFVILDEAQNATRQQMKMLLTRIGTGTSAVVTGDPTQVDLPKGGSSGLAHALGILKNVRRVGICRFEQGDVMRHPLVADIIKAYDADGARRSSARPGARPSSSPGKRYDHHKDELAADEADEYEDMDAFDDDDDDELDSDHSDDSEE